MRSFTERVERDQPLRQLDSLPSGLERRQPFQKADRDIGQSNPLARQPPIELRIVDIGVGQEVAAVERRGPIEGADVVGDGLALEGDNVDVDAVEIEREPSVILGDEPRAAPARICGAVRSCRTGAAYAF